MRRMLKAADFSRRTALYGPFSLALLSMLPATPAQAQRAQKLAQVPNIPGFPDATTTGVSPGIALKPSGPLVIETPGAVIEGLDIAGSVAINAANVTLKNCRVTSDDYSVINIKRGITGTIIQNCEVDNLGAGGAGISGQGTFLNNNIHDCADGIDVRGDNTLIQGNFIHRMRGKPDSHFDGIQADGGFSNLTISNNTVINEHGQTSALMLDNYWGPIDNVVIDSNLLTGGGYAVYINEVAKGQAGGGPVTNVTFTNNRIGRGAWGNFNLRTELGLIPVISGNVSATTGALLPGQRARSTTPKHR